MKGELETKDKQLIGITSELERLREDQHSLKGEVKDRGSAITTLQIELEKVGGEVLERDVAIANLKAELEARGDVKQLSLFSEPELETETVPTPEPEPTQKPPTKTLTRGELVKYIIEKFPDSKINGQKITDAIAGKSKNLPKFEGEYGFKYLGKIKGENRFSIP